MRRRMLALRVFSPAQPARFTPDESTSNPPRRFLADFYLFECHLLPEIRLGIPEEAATPNQVRVILGCWSGCLTGLPVNCVQTWPSLPPPAQSVATGRFRCPTAGPGDGPGQIPASLLLLHLALGVLFHQSSRAPGLLPATSGSAL
jgi:hypothetical protein